MKKIKYILMVFMLVFATVSGEQAAELIDENVSLPRVFNKNNQPFTGKVKRGKNIESYKNGLPNGTWTSYYTNGSRKSIANWKDGVLHGSYTVYRQSGAKAIENSYSNGLDHGKYIIYYPNGRKRIEGVFDKGNPVGVWQYYSQDGKLVGRNDLRKSNTRKK